MNVYDRRMQADGYMTLPAPTDPGPSVPGLLKLAEYSQYLKNLEVTVQEVLVQEHNGKQHGSGGPKSYGQDLSVQ